MLACGAIWGATLRLRPDQSRQPMQPLRGLHNSHMIRRRDAAVSIRHSSGIRLDSQQPKRHVLCGCCGVTWRLYFAGRPCLNLKFIFGARGAGDWYWGGHILERRLLTTP